MKHRIFSLAIATLAAAPGTAPAELKADRIVVKKADRTMLLEHNGKTIRRYSVALGREPEGHKNHEGDGRTPEGLYWIDARNPDSAFFLSLRISYPNARDRARAAAAGEEPGGAIMIHGDSDELPERRAPDWTDGCIAVSDAEMEEIWRLVDVGTPIEITP